ncbi:hypothetical protein WME94_25215 [Sorangium sp. So ce429]
MSVIVSTLTSLPFTQLRRNRYFYLYHDGFYALVCATLLSWMLLGGHAPLIERWDDRLWLLLPLVCHAQILCSVFIHNATHNNFPRPINWSTVVVIPGRFDQPGNAARVRHHGLGALFEDSSVTGADVVEALRELSSDAAARANVASVREELVTLEREQPGRRWIEAYLASGAR